MPLRLEEAESSTFYFAIKANKREWPPKARSDPNSIEHYLSKYEVKENMRRRLPE